ncbi:MAG: response regulator [Planctomycetaceae bacterium]
MAAHILIVDDSPADRLIIGHFLQRDPEFTITFATDGIDAIESVQRQRPALILSDLRMPGMNGLELVRKLNGLGLNIPVILMTSFGSEQIAVDALSAGAASYVAKRNLESELVNTISNVMAVTERKENRRRTLECLAYSESHFVLGNDTSSAAHLISHLLDAALTMRLLSGHEQTHVGIALQEALSNAIHHGNLELDSELRQVDEWNYYALADQRRKQQPYASRRVYVAATLSRSELQFVITDEGPGFDTTKVLDPTAEVNLDRIGGRGLLLIRSFMDSVTYNECGNQITMTKYVSAVESKVITFRSASCSQSTLDAAACG